ncbi:hypothetical protein L915_20389 [Phytophthora nicotianae]|uniref:Uncharacterized protein n=1 Tax=Phytophthora nicotianae TaxID=4792 RepID=W2HVF9_PHYNI|nr:hypothetical protein L915_20389 [Phytophthora nicotianae]ETL25969.1 hypothetical protein L916_20249 [Phytophthora nicotianae]
MIVWSHLSGSDRVTQSCKTSGRPSTRRQEQAMVSLFGKKKEGRTLRPRVRRATPLMDIGLAVILGAVTGVYIFKDTMQRWQISEGEYVAAEVSKANQAAQKAQTSAAQDATRN